MEGMGFEQGWRESPSLLNYRGPWSLTRQVWTIHHNWSFHALPLGRTPGSTSAVLLTALPSAPTCVTSPSWMKLCSVVTTLYAQFLPREVRWWDHTQEKSVGAAAPILQAKRVRTRGRPRNVSWCLSSEGNPSSFSVIISLEWCSPSFLIRNSGGWE